MDLSTIVGLVSGAAGGNVAGKVLGNLNQGTLINSIAGIAGGGIGGTVLNSLLGAGAASGGMGIESIISQVAGGGIGGGALLAIVGVVKNMLAK